MDDHWSHVREMLIDFEDIPSDTVDRLIASAQEWGNARLRPEQCAGAQDEVFCTTIWLSLKYWKWRAGGEVPCSWRAVLEQQDAPPTRP
jgi:hypothetical protein